MDEASSLVGMMLTGVSLAVTVLCLAVSVSSSIEHRMSTLYNIDVHTLSNVVAGAVSQAIQQQNPNAVPPTVPSTTVATLPGTSTTPVVTPAGSSARLVQI